VAELFDALSSPWAIRALSASILVGIMCGVLGCFIVLRNMSLIGDALAHAVLPGVFFAFLLVGYSTLGFFIGSSIAGFVCAITISWIQQNVKTKNDAAIGIIFTTMFAIGIMGISYLNKDTVHLDLKDFLYGNVLGISDEDLYLTLGVTVYTVLCVVVFFRYIFITTFQPMIADTMGISSKLIHYFLMLLLSFVVVASIRTVGVILVVAMLITPASTALLLTSRFKIVIVLSALFGALSAISGLLISIVFGLTPAPAMTLVATSFYLLAVLFAPESGVIPSYRINRLEKFRIMREDILKQVFKRPLVEGMPVLDIAKNLNLPATRVKSMVGAMSKSSLLSTDSHNVILSKEGIDHAERLVRAHRLWETYQVKQMGLNSDQIHEEAEHLEHFLSEELVDEIDKKLGYPPLDPHDSPIPAKKEKK